ncbi:MAG: Fic family protein [Armatimonadetes bacterium]|nr:MAG: Fic family protein [Armatimonadota bacterium]
MSLLSESPVGRTITITGHDHRFGEDYAVEAFLPDPLPTDIRLPSRTWSLVTDAMAELGRLDAAAQLLPNPQLVARVATRLEAVGTSALEGTYANLAELFAAEVEATGGTIPARVREVMNYIAAVSAGSAWIEGAPITRGLMSTMQATLVEGTESDGPEAGDVRTTRVFIGPKHRPITEARFVPPPPGDQLLQMYEDWFEWVRDDRNPPEIPLLVRVAMAHYQFETIHPYHDGNGRVGRLAAMLQLIREGVLSSPVLSLSPWLKSHEDEYKDRLLAVSETGDWVPWVEFFITAVTSESRAAQKRIRRLLELQSEVSETVRELVPRGRLAVDIADDLIGFPIVSVSSAQQRYRRSNQAARNAVNRLVDVGILEAYDHAAYDKRYWNPRVFQVIGD